MQEYWADLLESVRLLRPVVGEGIAVACSFLLACWDEPWGKGVVLALSLFPIVSLIAFVYSGEEQRKLSQPLEFRKPSKPIDEKVLQGPSVVVPHKVNGLYADCIFYLVYEDARGRSRQHTLYRRQMQLTTLGRRLPAQQPTEPSMIEQAYDGIPNLTFSGVDRPDVEAIAIAGSIGDTIQYRAATILRRPIDRLERVKKIPLWRRLRRERLAKLRPATDKEPSLHMRTRYNVWPLFVLSTHPDREVKTTAWVTVITSLFAIAMQLMYTPPATDGRRPTIARPPVSSVR